MESIGLTPTSQSDARPLRLGRAAHERGCSLQRVNPVEQDIADGLGDGHIDSETGSQFESASSCVHALGNIAHIGEYLRQPLSSGQLLSDVPVPAEGTGAGRCKIPEASQPCEREWVRAGRHAQAGYLHQAAGDEGRLAIVPVPVTVAHTLHQAR